MPPPSQYPPQICRAEYDEITGRRLRVVEPRCLLVAKPQRMRFSDCRFRRVIPSPRRDIGEGIDLAILDEDRLRRRRLGNDDLPASQRNGGRADADAALPAPSR